MSDPKDISKPKVFLCYAQEDHSLFEDFVTRFKNHNDNLTELLYDAPFDPRNIHERFRDYAESCEIAILLVSPRFTLSTSYTSLRELPILRARQKTSQLTLIGIRFMDMVFEDWNSDGDIPFFSLKNRKLSKTYREKINENAHNDAEAIYELIEPEDRNTYHKELKKCIKDVCSKLGQKHNSNTLEQKTEANQLKHEDTQGWEEKIDPNLFNLESKLRAMKPNDLWNNDYHASQKKSISYVQAYLTLHGDMFEELETNLRDFDPDDGQFVRSVETICKKPREVCKQFHELLEEGLISDRGLVEAAENVIFLFNVLKEQLLLNISDNTVSGNKKIKAKFILPLAKSIRAMRWEMDGFAKKYHLSTQN